MSCHVMLCYVGDLLQSVGQRWVAEELSCTRRSPPATRRVLDGEGLHMYVHMSVLDGEGLQAAVGCVRVRICMCTRACMHIARACTCAYLQEAVECVRVLASARQL